jgi:hypothetical protein
MTLKIDLLKIDMEAGKHFMPKLYWEKAMMRLDAISLKYRADRYDAKGMHEAAAKFRAQSDAIFAEVGPPEPHDGE